MDKVLISWAIFDFYENLLVSIFLYKYFSSSLTPNSTFKWNLTFDFRFGYSKNKNLIMVSVLKIKLSSSLVTGNVYKKNNSYMSVNHGFRFILFYFILKS
jgi:hypothetical protein